MPTHFFKIFYGSPTKIKSQNWGTYDCTQDPPQPHVEWIAGDVPIYLKFALKVTHPFRKRRFRRISLNSIAAVIGSEKS